MIWLRFRFKKRWLKGKKKLKGMFHRRLWKLFLFCNLLTFVVLSLMFLLIYVIFAAPSPNESVLGGTRSEARNDASGRSVCRAPKINPFHKSVIKLVREPLRPLRCENGRYPVVFGATVDPTPTLIPVHSKEFVEGRLGISKCCYRTISRGPGGFNSVKIGTSHCHTVSLDKRTQIPPVHPFILVECLVNGVYKAMDAHAFINTMPENSRSKMDVKEELNVIVIGLSSVSRASFIRSMPKSYTFLMLKLSPVEFKAYHAIGGKVL